MPGRNCLLALLLSGTCLLAGPPVSAETPAWDELSPDQQEALEKFSHKWDGWPDGKRERLLNIVSRWCEMTPEEQEATRKRIEEWRKMKKERREKIREKAERFNQLPPEEQERIRKQYREFRDMNPERREELRRRWEEMSPDERAAALEKFREHRDL